MGCTGGLNTPPPPKKKNETNVKTLNIFFQPVIRPGVGETEIINYSEVFL